MGTRTGSTCPLLDVPESRADNGSPDSEPVLVSYPETRLAIGAEFEMDELGRPDAAVPGEEIPLARRVKAHSHGEAAIRPAQEPAFFN